MTMTKNVRRKIFGKEGAELEAHIDSKIEIGALVSLPDDIIWRNNNVQFATGIRRPYILLDQRMRYSEWNIAWNIAWDVWKMLCVSTNEIKYCKVQELRNHLISAYRLNRLKKLSKGKNYGIRFPKKSVAR